MPLLLLILSLSLTLAGIAVLLLLWRRWDWMRPWAKRSWAKPAVALCRAALAITTAWGREVLTTVLAIVGWLCWEVADWWAGEKSRQDKEAKEKEKADEVAELKRQLAEAKGESERWKRATRLRATLLSALSGIVNAKNRRMRRSVGTMTARVPIQRARSAFASEEHTGFLLEQLALLFERLLPEERSGGRQNFRVCLFVAAEGLLTPVDGFDLNARRRHPFASYDAHERHFRLDNAVDPAHAVLCLQRRAMLLVPDCSTEPTFQRFEPGQESHLKSLVAYPILDYGESVGADVPAALVIDTDATNHFREEDRETLGILLREFAAHLSLEDAIREALC